MTYRSVSTISLFVACAGSCSHVAPQQGSASATPSAAGSVSLLVAAAVALPTATHTAALPSDAPQVAISSVQIFLDGAPAGSTRVAEEAGRLQRIEALFEGLKSRYDQWKAAHPGQRFADVIIWRDSKVPALVVKSVIQTAAFAGYPNAFFAVQKPGTRGGPVSVSAKVRVPRPQFTASDAFLLHVEHLEPPQDKYRLVWKYGNEVLRTFDTTAAQLPGTLTNEWNAYGGHRHASDERFDQAVLHVENTMPFGAVVSMLDALHGPERELAAPGGITRVPAFEVTFAVN